MLQKYKWTIRLTVLTPFLLVLAIFLMGGGHGYFEPTFVLFPLATILFFWYHTMNPAFLCMALIQYSLYGFILDKYRQRLPYIGLLIILLHLSLAILSYSICPEIFK